MKRCTPDRRGAGLALLLALAWTATATGAQSTAAPTTSPRSHAVMPAGGPEWSSLSAAQRSALAPLEHEWSGIDATRRQKWLEVATRFPAMGAGERQRMQTRMSEWARMTPQERSAARLHFQEARQIDPTDRQARWEQYQSLSPEQRQALVDRSRSAPAAKQQPVRKAGTPVAKSNLVTGLPAADAPLHPVSPSVIQARTGATTTLISRQPASPLHQQPGLPKIAASPGFVDRTTLLPQRGPQAAAATPPDGSSADSSRR